MTAAGESPAGVDGFDGPAPGEPGVPVDPGAPDERQGPEARPSPVAGKRPATITILAGLLVAKAVVSVAIAVGWAIGEAPFISTLGLPSLLAGARDTAAVTALFLGIGGVLGVAAIGLLTGRRSGWLLAMVTTGVFIAADIVTFGAGTAHHLWMLVNIVTVFYLNQRDVREAFLPPADDGRDVAALA